MKAHKFHVTVRTDKGSTIVHEVAADDMADALKAVTNYVIKGEYQSMVDYTKPESVQVYRVKNPAGL